MLYPRLLPAVLILDQLDLMSILSALWASISSDSLERIRILASGEIELLHRAVIAQTSNLPLAVTLNGWLLVGLWWDSMMRRRSQRWMTITLKAWLRAISSVVHIATNVMQVVSRRYSTSLEWRQCLHRRWLWLHVVVVAFFINATTISHHHCSCWCCHLFVNTLLCNRTIRMKCLEWKNINYDC